MPVQLNFKDKTGTAVVDGKYVNVMCMYALCLYCLKT